MGRASNTKNSEEYSIYVYRFPEDIKAGHADWEKKRTTHSKYRAMRMARKYHESSDYHRVEVKRKAFSPKYDCNIDKVFKVLETDIVHAQTKRRLIVVGGVIFLSLAIVLGLLLV